MTNYNITSPYSNTGMYGNYLDVLSPRVITASQADQIMTINLTYQYRPDLLAHDLYENKNLWWVFAARNPNTLKDPVFDMKSGVEIFLPEQGRLFKDLGL
tara:strand:+ start:7270 stop:7569 length:300 start_codon:yes stop_codon:yes gene_type:complete